MGVRIGSGLSRSADVRDGAVEAASDAKQNLEGRRADLAVVFASGAYLAAPEAMLEGIHEALNPSLLIGCGASGVVGLGQEIEGGSAVVVWAGDFDGGTVRTFHASSHEHEETFEVSGLPSLEGASGVIILPDPYSFATDVFLGALKDVAPGVPVLGGLSSARTFDGAGALFYGERVVEEGAVGARLDGVELLPCVSQGAAPIGPELTITRAERSVIHELAGKPALAKLREVFEESSEREQGLLSGGLLLGLVTDLGKPEYEQGDFLVRGLLGGDAETGAISVGTPVREGQVVRLHARDALSADRDLREALDLRRRALGQSRAAGALIFTCNGRGREMFGISDHDASALSDCIGEAPAAGFFAAGEIGPVGGETFLHGFTATIVLFAP